MSLRALIFACALPFAAQAAAADVFAIGTAPAGAAMTPVADATPMRVILTLPLGHEAAARAYSEAVSDPKSPLYGRYLTPTAFGARFGGDAGDYEALRDWAKAQGLAVGPRLDSRTELSFSGTAGQFAAIFGTGFQRFPTTGGDEGYTVTRTPTLPAALAGRVDGVIGLTSAGRRGLFPLRTRHADVGTGVNGSGYAPADLKTAYDVPKQRGGKTEVVAIFEQCGYRTSDLAKYEKAYKLPAVPNQQISVNGSPTGQLNDAELEADLDLDMVIGLNPKLGNILVYEDSYTHDSFQVALLDSINQVAQDNKATVFSISYGQDESMQGKSAIRAEGKALLQLRVQGIAVFASSGDEGAAGRSGTGLHAPDPGSQPLITSVGGTRLTTDPKTQQWVSEVVWNDLAQGYGATGGGVSDYWKIPDYQLLNGMSVAVANGGSATHRNVPDVAAVADPFTPVSVYSVDNGGWVGVGGTSVSAPVWAGIITIFNGNRANAGKARLGFLNPRIYRIAETYPNNHHDVTSGNNGNPGYMAGPGYDNCTGWGTPDVRAIMHKMAQ